MKVDESGAPWPYDAVEPEDEDAGAPTWKCPGGLCECHPTEGDGERIAHRVLFFDQEARIMAGARCRVFENDQLINSGAPYADGGGAVQVNVRPSTRVLEIEWAPQTLPSGPRYPFRKQYYLNLGKDLGEGVARRLHNLGFSVFSALEDNIRDFQRTYEQSETGLPEHVSDELAAFHDKGLLPPVPASNPGMRGAKTQLADAKAPPAASPVPVGGGAASSGVHPQGSAAAVQTTKVRIQLHMAFSLHESDFDPSDVDWADVPYDMPKMLTTLYPTPLKQNWRLAGVENSNPISGAILTRVEMDGSEAKVSDASGAVVFELETPSQDGTPFAIRVEPPPNQLNTTGKPAGPALTNEQDSVKFLFRPFLLFLHVDATGALQEDGVQALPDDRPRHARILSAKKRVNSGNNVIVVDWRPDWMASGTKKSRIPRLTEPRDTPINPFDLSKAATDRLTTAPPAVVIHQTGTHHLSFLPGFISDSNEDNTSIHYVVDFDGFAIKVLDEFYRANHGGWSLWEQRLRVNQFTVGIETMHTDTTPLAPAKNEKFKITPRRFTKEQYDTFIRLGRELKAEYGVTGRRFRGHMEVLATEKPKRNSDGTVALGRDGKPVLVQTGILSRDRSGCPGPFFEWQRLEEGGVSLAAAQVPSQPPTPDLAPAFAGFDTLRNVKEIKPKSNSPEGKLIKQLLFDIGYSVTEKLPAFTNRSELPRVRASLTDEYDIATQEAVRAFQTHHFSGRRRAYTLVGNPPKDGSAPAVGTLDRKTVQAIMEVWFSAMTASD